MAENNQDKTSIRIAGLPPMSLAVKNKEQAELYHAAEDLVNNEWAQYDKRYGRTNISKTEIMSMVAFRFALLYLNGKESNEKVNGFLKEFEKKLDEIVVKV